MRRLCATVLIFEVVVRPEPKLPQAAVLHEDRLGGAGRKPGPAGA